jgi:O-antigen/teichoic acid export membrane protein
MPPLAMEPDRLDMSTDASPIPELNTVVPGPAATPPTANAAPKARSLLFLVGALIGGNLIGRLLGMAGGFLQARYVDPEVLGLFGEIGLVLGYVRFLQLGILNGLNRELPYHIGKGDRKRGLDLAAAAQAWALVIGGAVGIALLAVAACYLFRGELPETAGWATFALLAFALFYNTYYLQMTYRTSHDFARLAMANVVENAVGLAAVVLVAVLSFYGLCLRALLAAATSLAILYYWRPLHVRPIWSVQHLKHLLVIGVPIFWVGELYAFWGVLNSSLVAGYLGKKGMGLFALVAMASSTLDLLPNALAQVIYPRMAEQFGRTGKLRGLVRMSLKPMFITAAGMALLVAVGWWFVEPFVRIALPPKWMEAVPAVRWSLLVPIVSSFGAVNSIFPVVRRMTLYGVAVAAGMAVNAGFLVWYMWDRPELTDFPQAMLVGRIAFMFVCYAMIAVLCRREGRAAR